MEWSYFIGQEVTDINSINRLLSGISFQAAELTIECPWRLRNAKEVLIGYSYCVHAPDRYSYKTVKTHLAGNKIKSIQINNLSDFVVEFENELYLELFHDSSYFEGWQLQGDNGFHIISLPGGSYTLFE